MCARAQAETPYSPLRFATRAPPQSKAEEAKTRMGWEPAAQRWLSYVSHPCKVSGTL